MATRNIELIIYVLFLMFFCLHGNTVEGVDKKCKLIGQMMDCSDCELKHVPSNIPGYVEILNMSGCNIRNINKETFASIAHLKLRELVLQNCSIQTVSRDTFINLTYLGRLDLSENTISIRDLNNAFESLKNSPLRILNISSMALRNLSGIHFSDVKSVRNISIRGNKLTEIPEGTFSNLTNITNLDLSINLINKMSLTGLSTMTVLNLTFNELSNFPKFCDGQGKSLVPKLKELRIGINHINNIQEVTKEGHFLPELTYLNLSFNPIRIIRNNSFSTYLSLRKLRLENLMAYGIIFEVAAFNLSTLRSLYIGNTIRVSRADFDNEMFTFCPNLLALDIANWKLLDFNETDLENMVKPLTKLKKLVLANTDINFMPTPSTIANLTTLDVQDNYIRKIDKSMFTSCKHLVKLNMHRNHLSTVTESSFPQHVWDRLTFLDLSFNPFNCVCDFRWFRNWLKIKENSRKLVNYPDLYQCDLPDDLKGKNILVYDPTKEECINPYIPIYISVCAFLFIIIFIGILLRKFRWDIKYHLRNVGMLSKRKYQRISSADEYLYDGFIAYNTDDRKWIMSQLIENLERKHKYRLCLHERDFLPGDVTVEQISEKLHESRKFVLVLSNNFAASQWCQYETLLAHHTLAEEGKRKLILILLEDIKSMYITNSLKVLLRSISHVQWTMNIRGKQLFWDKLRELLDKN